MLLALGLSSCAQRRTLTRARDVAGQNSGRGDSRKTIKNMIASAGGALLMFFYFFVFGGLFDFVASYLFLGRLVILGIWIALTDKCLPFKMLIDHVFDCPVRTSK